MEKPTSFSAAKSIHDLENAVGRLSAVQKILLGTDGSVTSLLEVVTGSPIQIETLEQKVIAADVALADDLGVSPGDDINHRVVKLKKAGTEETLIYAVSHTPLKRLEAGIKEDMIRADIPIGVILKRHQIESRRDITGTGFLKADRELARVFDVFPRELMLQRSYKIFRHSLPLIAIRETFPYNSFQDEHKVVIETPARLHLTLTDLSGSSARVDGGVGITLDEPNILLEAKRAGELSAEGEAESCERILAAARAVQQCLDTGGARFTVRSGYRLHMGLGGGTQLGIAAGKAISELYHKPLGVREIARIIHRGGTSGIGTAAFDSGGFIIDGGHSFGPGKDKMDFRPSAASAGVRPPPVILRHAFPQDWKILVALPDIPQGAHGQKEVDIFRKYCPLPVADVHELCYQILVRMVPSLLEEDLDEFGGAVNRIQEIGFKKVEVMLQHPVVHRLMAAAREAGSACSGLSSFGPAVYAITDAGCRDIEAATREAMQEVGGEVLITRCRNGGARVRMA
ncbi:Beta-ribofuranosylaminobenzene 5'-phosphate synthase [uncultured archaeon]|nr:Beta-ribofuranosylaminobenzene 5'-phosphate synthase [uncultured archaeon]